MKKKALSILLALLLALTAWATAATPEVRAAGSASIQSLALERGSSTAQVTLTVGEENTLLVAVYDVNQKMVALGAHRVAPGESTVSVTLTAPAPRLFQAEAFLLNDAQAPTCESVPLDRLTPPPFTESLTFVKEGNAYTVTGVGDETTVVIPAEYEGLPVTKIQGHDGTGAFAQKAFTSVTIPDTVVEIGQNSFYGCKQLTQVELGENSNLTTIGNNAFSGCAALKTMTIPKGVTTLGDSAFNNCSSLESFAVADGNTVFRSENGHLIETATQTLIRGANQSAVPEGVKALEARSFQRANGITELNIPTSVTKLGSSFLNASTITKINYAGTQAQWDQIEKGSMWNYGNRDVQVVCAPSKPNILIAYFSATNTTEGVAEKIAAALGDGKADLFEIVPAVPYTSADLNYNTDCRANREQNDPSARPAIAESSKVDSMEQYDVVFLGYPIWWGQAPKIMYTFLESYDFNGKTVVPFCTSGSSGMGSSASNLAKTASGATWLSGNRFSGGVSQSTVQTWVDGLNLNLSR